jgi:hypothetical protein
MDDKKLLTVLGGIQNELGEVRKELRRVAVCAGHDLLGSPENMGRQIARRLEALESIVMILVREQSKGVRKELEKEIENRNAVWLQSADRAADCAGKAASSI